MQQQPKAQEPSLEAILKAFMTETKAGMRNLEAQVGQLATAINSRPIGTLPASTEEPKCSNFTNSNEQCNAIQLRSGKIIEGAESMVKKTEKEKVAEQPAAENEPAVPDAAASPPAPRFVQERPPPPFPQRLRQLHQEKQFGKFLEVLKQLHINIPLLEALKQMPNYIKFMKDVLSKKRRLGEFETVAMTKESSMMLQNKVPQKMKDPGSFAIPCSIGGNYVGKALCDLGASINLMPMSIFKKLGIGEARPTSVTLQLADRSIAYPEGKIEDVLIKVDKFVFPADFIILDFEADAETPIILGRPFLATGKTLIDVQQGKLTMRVNDQQVTFNVFDALKYPDDSKEECSMINSIDNKIHEHPMLQQNTCDKNSDLKHATLPVIISSKWTDMQEQQLVNTLKKHTKAMGWQISDMHGISPSLCMNRILLQHDAKSRKRNQKKEKRRKKRKKKKKNQREMFRFWLQHPKNQQRKELRTQKEPKTSDISAIRHAAGCSMTFRTF